MLQEDLNSIPKIKFNSTTGINLFLAGLCLFVFWQVSGYSFVNYDDFEYVSQNPYIEQGLNPVSIAWAICPGDDWMPLSKLSHMAVVQFFGMDPRAHHAANLLFHLANVLLLFSILKLWTKDLWRSAAVAALFAVHPLQAEAVSWVTARKDLLAAFSALLALRAYHPEKRNILWASIFFALSVLSKPSLVALPPLLLFLEPKNWKQLWPLFAIAGAFCVATFQVQHRALEFVSSSPLPLRALDTVVFYLGKIFWPARLTIYGRVPDAPLTVTPMVVSVSFLAALSVVAFRLRKKEPKVLVGWIWFLILLLPVLVLEVPADRYLYFPVIGILIAVVWVFPKQWVIPAALLSVCVLSPLCYAQSAVWKNSATLFNHALALNDQNYTAHVNFAETLVDEGNLAQAQRHYLRAIELKPDNAEALTSLGVLFEKRHQLKEAEEFQRRALAAQPDHAKAHFNLANVLQAQGQTYAAVAYFLKAVHFKPDYAEAYFNAASALEDEGRRVEAKAYYAKALEIKPLYPKARNNLGLILIKEGLYKDAIVQFRKILAKDPSDVEARNNLAVTLTKSGDNDGAIREFERILKDHPDLTPARANLELIKKRNSNPNKGL